MPDSLGDRLISPPGVGFSGVSPAGGGGRSLELLSEDQDISPVPPGSEEDGGQNKVVLYWFGAPGQIQAPRLSHPEGTPQGAPDWRRPL